MDVDHNNRIPLPKCAEIQPEFSCVIECVVAKLTLCFPDLIHSLYVYGSVAEGRAEIGKSDLDMTVIFKNKLDQVSTKRLDAIQSEIEKNNSVISKIDFDCGLLEQVLNSANLLSWGYWLKHHCRCVYGEDLSHRFQPFRPSKAIAVAVNADFRQVLCGLITQMKASSNESRKFQLLRSAARKLVRSTNILRSEQDNEWPGTLQEHRTWFIARYPTFAKDMEYLLAISTGARENIADAEKKLFAFASWLDAEFHTHEICRGC